MMKRGDILKVRINGAKVLNSPTGKVSVVGSLTRQDELIFLGEQTGDFLQVQGGFGKGWIESIFVERAVAR